MKSFSVDDVNSVNENVNVNTKDVWVLLFSTMLVLSMWKNYSPFLTLLLSGIVVFQVGSEVDRVKKNLKLYTTILGGAFFVLLTNGKEVPLRFSNPDIMNIPLWILPFFSILFSGFNSLMETSKVYF